MATKKRDPFEDAPAEVEAEVAEEAITMTDTPVVAPTIEGGFSVTWVDRAGYDRLMIKAWGSAEELAARMNLKRFDGKLSSLMKQAVAIDKEFKKMAGGSQGKA